ncbi:hypothetical protein [Lentilactobacillus sp. Marseille-Q4993]|uniref:phage tail assembly chaperone n=1 Tax=Lentilactobacillus sp. Marseille-Q4993 TaxID=3039492 RepID=UPI0024BD35C9|nr:hypothetical protein [Lentilactobacillus sp. Marseille-Q4993]
MAQVNIADFLAENVDHEIKKQEVKLPRFKSPFILKELTNDENEALQKRYTKQRKNPRTGQVERDIDQTGYAEAFVAASVIQPDLNNAELQKSYATMGDAVATLKKMLKLNEFMDLTQKAQQLSGIGETLEDEVKEVKK